MIFFQNNEFFRILTILHIIFKNYHKNIVKKVFFLCDLTLIKYVFLNLPYVYFSIN